MKSVSLKLSVAAAALAGIAASSVAFADDSSALGTVSAALAVTTDYRFRGITQDNKEATPQLTINWSGAEGFYAGAFFSKTNWGGTNNPSFETDLFVGKHTDLGGTDLNTQLIYYTYPDYDDNHGATKDASYMEGIVQLSHAFGPMTITGTGAFSPHWSLIGGTSAYTGGTASYTVTDWLSLSGNIGYQWLDNMPKSNNSYVHWDLGATATWKSFALDLRYIDTDMSKDDCSAWMSRGGCKAGFAAMLTYNIASLF